MTSIGEENKNSQCLCYKNKNKGKERKKNNHRTNSREDCGRNSIGVVSSSQMTSHCNANHSTPPPPLTPTPSFSILSLAVFCHNPLNVTASRRTWSFCLKELSEWQDLTVTGRLFHRKASEKAILVFIQIEYIYPWLRQTKVILPGTGLAWGTAWVQINYILYLSKFLERAVADRLQTNWTQFACQVSISQHIDVATTPRRPSVAHFVSNDWWRELCSSCIAGSECCLWHSR